ncbi:MAG TPA: hypothetical protein VEZ50_09110 [Nodosilinea sp.]|nr:hypothetical protein [Nodosilinea sp.]
MAANGTAATGPGVDGATGDLAERNLPRVTTEEPGLNGEIWSQIDHTLLPQPKPQTAKPSQTLGLAQAVPLEPNGDAEDIAEDIEEVDAAIAEAEAIAPAPHTPAPSQLDRDVAQTPAPAPAPEPLAGLAPAERSEVFAQAAYLQQGDEGSARLRVGGIYVLSPSVFAGATVDLSTGQAFSDTDQTGLSLSELYLTASPANLPELRFTVGLMDLTSYLDRNSFAKDSLTHFFNPVFQTNPALATANVASRPGALVNWTPVDAVSLTATTFSASRDLGSFALDSFAGEVGVRFGNAIVRGTYVTSTDAGRRDGFSEIFAIDRGNGQFGPLPGDRETGFGLNAEAFIPNLKLGFFGRYGWYTNQTLGASGQTYSLGVNGLDVFMPGDRLGLGYGRQLSNSDLRQASGGPTPDVWELFYDAQIIENLRAGVSVQQRNAFSETYLGFRVRYDLMWNPLRRAAE